MSPPAGKNARSFHRPITVFLTGDVMTGRGIDQILSHPSDPTLHERSVRDARRYVELAEQRSGPIRRQVELGYVWGAALEELNRRSPDLRIINLETTITSSDAYWSGKGIHYRMHPGNVPCLSVAGIDCCVLANNHVLDWGSDGLEETIRTLHGAGIKTVGAGQDLSQAREPAVFELGDRGRVLVFALGSPSGGVPVNWAATDQRAGVWVVDESSRSGHLEVRDVVSSYQHDNDLVILSIHWGPNWGFKVSGGQRDFARRMIDESGVDLVYGHSSHHVKAMEIYHDKPVFYGCGDFLNDYEGIQGYERYRGDLGLMYFVTLSPGTGRLSRLEMIPTMVRQFKVNRAPDHDAAWLAALMQRESKQLGFDLEPSRSGVITLECPG